MPSTNCLAEQKSLERRSLFLIRKNSGPKVKATWFFAVWAVERIISGQLVCKIIITLSFRVSLSKNKNIDHRV